jgi:hypothetical protein
MRPATPGLTLVLALLFVRGFRDNASISEMLLSLTSQMFKRFKLHSPRYLSEVWRVNDVSKEA